LLTTQAQEDNEEPEKIIPDYEEKGRYCVCMFRSTINIQSESFSSIKIILEILHSLVHWKRWKPGTHCLHKY